MWELHRSFKEGLSRQICRWDWRHLVTGAYKLGSAFSKLHSPCCVHRLWACWAPALLLGLSYDSAGRTWPVFACACMLTALATDVGRVCNLCFHLFVLMPQCNTCRQYLLQNLWACFFLQGSVQTMTTGRHVTTSIRRRCGPRALPILVGFRW